MANEKKDEEKKVEKPFRPATAVYAAPTPEVSLCLRLVDEAIQYGWRCIPEYPKSRFDILLIAEPWVSTEGAVPGMQVGVQAKMELTEVLMKQIEYPLRHLRNWSNPEYLVALIPVLRVSAATRSKVDSLKMMGVGLFTAYDTFNGNEHPTTKESQNLVDMKKFGRPHQFRGQVLAPPADYPFVLPGSVGGQHWSPWKDKALNLIVNVLSRDGKFLLADFREHKVDPRVWLDSGWIEKTEEKVGAASVYKLSSNSPRRRVDLQHPHEFKRRMKEKNDKKVGK